MFFKKMNLILVLFVVSLAALGCNSAKDGSKSNSQPEEVVQNYVKAVQDKDVEKAYSLLDTEKVPAIY